MPARLRVTNIPLHIRKEEFASIFGNLEGCMECRLVNENDKCAPSTSTPAITVSVPLLMIERRRLLHVEQL